MIILCTHQFLRYGWAQGCKLFVPVLWTQRQADLCESEASMVYRVSSRAITETLSFKKKRFVEVSVKAMLIFSFYEGIYSTVLDCSGH